jgi:pyridinium-3,5-bisthiocarboxylic acid mononucleotide nickel chelatase
MKALFFDLQNGISGDMFVSSMLSAGVPQDYLLSNLNKVKYKIKFDVNISEVKVAGITALSFQVLSSPNQPCRNITDIKKIINNLDLKQNVINHSLNIFALLANAESKVHNCPVDKIHFHEVGAVDSIVDIISAAICMNYFDDYSFYSTPFYFGSGNIDIAHGKVSIPVPAVVEIAKKIPFIKTDIKGELVTPTGAAIIKYLINEFKNPDNACILSCGYGAGTKNYGIPNYLRTFIIEISDKNIFSDAENFDAVEEEVYKIETNIDDSSPEMIGGVIDELFALEALDVYQKTCFMKKNRIGIELNILIKKENLKKFLLYLFNNTSTIGIRYSKYNRISLNRKIINYNTSLGKVSVKEVELPSKKINCKLEYDDCKRIAEENELSVSDVYKILRKELDI